MDGGTTAAIATLVPAMLYAWHWPVAVAFESDAFVLIAVAAGVGAYRLFQDATIHLGISVIAAVIGLWMIVSPFAFGEVAQAVVASNVVAGILVLALSASVGYIGRERGLATTGGAAM